MGDVLSLIEKAQETFTLEQAEDAQKRLTSNTFTLEDFRAQLGQVSRLGIAGPDFSGCCRAVKSSRGRWTARCPNEEMKRVTAMIDR